MVMTMISICIPTYEMGGKGVDYLVDLIKSIYEQEFDDKEIIISDHSKDDAIYNLCKHHDYIKYVRFDHFRGNSSANLNNAIAQARGEIIKPMFQDDYFTNEYALLNISNALLNNSWVAMGNCIDRDGKLVSDMCPEWNNEIKYGKNTLSSPSCIAYRKCDIRWDERLIWMMDCKFYQDLYDKFGEPIIIPFTMVANRAHAGQLTNQISKERKENEVLLMEQEYGNRL